ncbi:hypothetical protein B0H34DRAFT_799310 [Crassisporium funariophilum]|nr:hypothetical protein B0H34DRAFT_799310 [Crassisporium funariophilum]
MATRQPVTVESLTNEVNLLQFSEFTATTAWTLGVHIRRIALAYPTSNPIAIRITHANGQILFATYTRPGAAADVESWISRKTATVFRWGTSTLAFQERIKAQGGSGRKVSEIAQVDDAVYTCVGGGFPVRVKGVEGVVAVVAVSGLPPREDHEVLIEGVRACIDEFRLETKD